MSDSKSINKLLYHANVMTESRYNFSVIEKRCYYLVLEQLRKNHSNTSKNLFNDLIVRMKHTSLEKAGDKHKKVYKSLENLREKKIYIEDDDKKLTTGFINYLQYDKRTKIYEVGVSHKLLPYLLDLVNHVYTSYDMVIVMSLKSEYSQRFYELCCQYRKLNRFFKTEEQLRKMFKLEDKYPSTYNFKLRTIDAAQKELQELYDAGQSDIYFTYRVKDKEGKKELSWWFDIHDRKKIVDNHSYKDLTTIAYNLKLHLNNYFPRDKKYVKRVYDAVLLNPDLIPPIAKKIHTIIEKYKSKTDVAKIIRFALSEDFDIN